MPARALLEPCIAPPVRLGDHDVIPLELNVFNPWDPHVFPHPFEAAITRVWMVPRRDVALPRPARLQPAHGRLRDWLRAQPRARPR
jgi:hypothetical protein